MDWVTTSTILSRMKQMDDRSIWDRFHGRFRRPLLAFARKCGLPESESEDAVQEILTAFLEAYKAGKYDRERGRLSKWLFGIAYTQIANRRRGLGRDRSPAQGESFWGDVPDHREAEGAWDAQWEASVLEECLGQVRREVSEKTFEVFRLIVREGRSPEEAGASLGMTREAAYVAKHRVLKRLADRMQEYEHFQG
jgi:RNA polymerase sigma factor (sigma-70 family)